jgi:predicted aspartyl protease
VADGRKVLSRVLGPVDISWQDRVFSTEVRLMPGVTSPIAGVLVLEGLDLTVNPKTQKVEGAHGDEAVEFLY